jgi:hypothetical protein
VQTLGENVPPELVFPPARKGRKRSSTVSVPEYTAAAGAAVVGRRRHAREMSRTLKHAASSTSLGARPVEIEPFSYPSLIPVSSFDVDPAAPPLPIPTDTRHMHRREVGWSGEWSGSVRNMEDVVRGLRDLRLK